MSNIHTLQQAILAIEELKRVALATTNRLDNLEDLNEVQLAEAKKLFGESVKAVDYAKHAFRVDHYGYIWRWDVDAQKYVKTTSMIGTPIIADESVSTEKILDGAVTAEKLSERSVDGAKIIDGQIAWGHLDKELQRIISSGGVGIAFATDFGESDLLGITQKTLTESRDFLQAQIDAIISGQTTVNLSASPSAIFVDATANITLSATASASASSINIKKGATVLATGSGTSLSYTDNNVSAASPGNIGYSAEFVIGSVTKTSSKNVAVVYPIYYGALSSYNAASLTEYNTPTTTSKRSYSININTTPRRIYFRIPKVGVTGINTVHLVSEGMANPVAGGYNSSLADVNYDVWESDDVFNVLNASDAGNRIFEINR